MSPGETSDLARAVQEVSERASTLVREEIELAKAEVSTKVSKLATGAAIGAAAGVFLVFALVTFLHGLAWLAWKLLFSEDDLYLGYFLVTGVLVFFAIIAGLIAWRLVKKGSPPTPQMAIHEAQLIKETVSDGRTA